MPYSPNGKKNQPEPCQSGQAEVDIDIGQEPDPPPLPGRSKYALGADTLPLAPIKVAWMKICPHREQSSRCRFNRERRRQVRCCRESPNPAGERHGSELGAFRCVLDHCQGSRAL
jgi:hypothetical protein